MNKHSSAAAAARFTGPRPQATRESAKGVRFVDYKDTDNLRRMMTPNGKIDRKSLSTTL